MLISSLNNKSLKHLITIFALIVFVLVLTIEFKVVYNGYRSKTENDTINIVNQEGFEKVINKIRR